MAKWRMLRLQANDAFINMALDEAISKSVAESKSVPTIRFYTWEPSAVSIGFFQGIHEEVNLNKCRELGVDVVRRRTGGGAVYHDSSGEITYSVIAPEKMMPKGITESYHLICGWIVKSLDLLGIKSEFKPINDIITDFKKISGNAQTRRDGILLQHGTILYDLDVEKMFSMLKVLQQKNIPIEELYDALVHGFGDGKDFDFAGLTEEEMIQASLLAESRYKTEEWNFMR